MMRFLVSREARHTRTTIAMNIAFDVCERRASYAAWRVRFDAGRDDEHSCWKCAERREPRQSRVARWICRRSMTNDGARTSVAKPAAKLIRHSLPLAARRALFSP